MGSVGTVETKSKKILFSFPIPYSRFSNINAKCGKRSFYT